jgi:hypothetical protein
LTADENHQNKTAAYAIFPVDTHMEDVLRSLNLAGFDNENICLFLTPMHPIAEGLQSMTVASSKDLSEEGRQAGLVSWLSRFGAVVIPGVGFFIGSREFLGALTPRGEQAPVVRNGELLSGLGIPQPDAARYEARIRSDANLIFVSCEGTARSQWAREILWRLRAEEVCLLGEEGKMARIRVGNVSSLVS